MDTIIERGERSHTFIILVTFFHTNEVEQSLTYKVYLIEYNGADGSNLFKGISKDYEGHAQCHVRSY